MIKEREPVQGSNHESTPWDDIAALAGQMGEPEYDASSSDAESQEKTTDQSNSDPETRIAESDIDSFDKSHHKKDTDKLEDDPETLIAARQKEAIDILLNYFRIQEHIPIEDDNAKTQKDNIVKSQEDNPTADGPINPKSLLEEFKEKSEGLWSHEYATTIIKRLNNEIESKIPEGQPIDERSAWELLEVGMPAKIILENEDFYQEMITNGSLPRESGSISQFYESMSKTKEGAEKFQHDFIESGFCEDNLSYIVQQAYDQGSIDETTLSDLKALRQYGVGPFSVGIPSYSTESKPQGFYQVTKQLTQENLLDGVDYSAIIENTLNHSNSEQYQLMMDAAAESGIEVQSDDKDIEYWGHLSSDSRENMIKKLCKGDASEIQETFDFTQEPVMRLFARDNGYIRYNNSIREYQSLQFREALKLPAFQDIILAAIEEQQFTHPLLSNTPLLFAMLAQDREILASMKERNAFDAYPACKQIDVINKFASSEYTERDRLSLFLEKDYTSPQFFDESGEPTKDFFVKLNGWGESGSTPAQGYFLDDTEKESYDEVCNTIREYLTLDNSSLISFPFKEKLDKSDYETLSKYFDASGPKPEFWQSCLEGKEFSFLGSQDEETKAKMGFDATTLAFIDFMELGSHSEVAKKLDLKELSKYFDASGPKPEFWEESFKKGDFEFLIKQDESTLEHAGFSEVQIKSLDAYKHIEDDNKLKELYVDFVSDNIEGLTPEKIEVIEGILKRLLCSNAEEVSNHPSDFAKAILFKRETVKEEECYKELEQIEDVFIHNNLPYFGKVFKTFRILYPEGEEHLATPALERGALKGRPEVPFDSETPPRTLEDFKKIIGSKDSIIFGDLLKATMGSNNRDLRNYLTDLMSGAELTEKVLSGETEFSEEEQNTLKVYAEHLKALQENTQKGKKQSLELTGDILQDIRLLSAEFSPTKRYNVPDRIVRSFGFMLGIRGCQDLLERMDHAVLEADKRNREAAARGNFKLESGDLIKATGVEYLGAILQNGSVSKEFLNGQAPTDGTPLDTDLNVLPDGLSGDISEGVDKKNAIAAFGKMHCMMVMKGDVNSGRSRFMTESSDGTYDPNKYEIWQNRGMNHGIRVGFPSTEIDYLIWDDLNLKDYYGDLKRMKYEIVKNGFYIPIVDKKSGQLIFNPDEYDEMRQGMSGLASLGGSKDFIAADNPERRSEQNFVETLALDSYTLSDGTVISSTNETVAKSVNNKTEVDQKRNAIIETAILPVLTQFDLTMKAQLDGDLTEGSAEVIDTGSTGRYANAPGDGDFDFMMKLDRSITIDEAKMDQIRDAFCDIFGLDTPEKRSEAIKGGNFRIKSVILSGLDEPVDIDITFATKTNKVQYSTDVALKEFYDSMDPAKREEVVANVVFAKQFLKAIKAYKPDRGDTPQGGLGGVGVENWILQNGGSFKAAAKDFMRVADECGDDFELFKGKFAVFDYGENHQGGGNDNFVTRNMSKEGYDKMRVALRAYLEQNGE